MSGDTLLRQWALLKAIPRHTQATVAELHRKLVEQGFTINKRTIERDLLMLERLFPLSANKNSKPYGWRWARDAKVMNIPGMDPPTALSFKLVEQYLERLMPRSTLGHLGPHFSRANEVLAQARGPLKSWTEKVRVISRGQRLQEPIMQPGVLDGVYEALLREKQFKVRYRTKSGQEKEYVVHPLGLVLRDQVAYLVCTLFSYDDVLQLVLHRMSSVEVLDDPAVRPAGFDLEAYIRSNQFDYPEGGPIQLEVLFEAEAAQHLSETWLSDDQRLEPASDGRVRVRATVADTQQLRWWLLGFGDRVEVVAPAALREEFRHVAERQLRRYSGKTALPA